MKRKLMLAVLGLSIGAAIFVTKFSSRLQEQPVIARLFHQPAAGLDQALRCPSVSDRCAVIAFTDLYAGTPVRTWLNTYWLGVPTLKVPLDLWVYQEIIYETEPDVLIEAGTYKGGSAHFFASVFELLKRGRVLTIDIQDYPEKPKHQRITYFVGSSTSEEISQKVTSSIRKGERVMVSLDSQHNKDHVLKELRLYSQLVTVGNYLVVEDTRFPAGEAVEEFMKETSDFARDESREKFLLTSNPGGFLKKVR